MSYQNQLALIKLGLLPKTTGAKPKKPLKKMSDKKKAEMKADKGDDALDKWFEERRKEMKGRCILCGGKSEKLNDDHYRKSIHHLFDKRSTMFPSVALHQDNWLEVCFWGNSCHTNIHNGTITWELLMDSAEGKIIVDKLKKIYPHIAENEKKNIPQILLTALDNTP
jgi:hypothetical protein